MSGGATAFNARNFLLPSGFSRLSVRDCEMNNAISTISNGRTRCPRCRGRAAVQGTVEIAPSIQYLTLRCVSCAAVYDAEVPTSPMIASALAHAIVCDA